MATERNQPLARDAMAYVLAGGREAEPIAHNGFDWSIEAVLPPLATVFFRQQA